MPFYCKECDLVHAHRCPKELIKEERLEVLKKQHEGFRPRPEFTIVCAFCGSFKVVIEHNKYFYPCDCSCDLTFICLCCGAETEIGE